MTITITSTRAVLALGLAFIYMGFTPATPAAADREHQQIMADLRMLQEQTQQLQALMNGLGEALKAVNSRLEDQTSLERKAFADGKVQMDAISGDIRVVREKVDETNVRLGSISQELESIRQAIPEPSSVSMMPPAITDPTTAAPGVASQTAAAPQTPINPGSPQRLFSSSFADYTGGNYSLAAQGFQYYLDSFPKSSQAHEAQFYIGEALFLDKKDAEAVVAYGRVIANYPASSFVPTSYYKRGLVFQRLGDTERANESFETVIKQFPDSQAAILAQQRLAPSNRPTK